MTMNLKLIILILALFGVLSLCVAQEANRGGIEFCFANPQISYVNDQEYFNVDIMAKGSQAGQRLGTGILLINYNPDLFGYNVRGQGNLTVTRGPLLLTDPFPFYGLITNDNSSTRLAITYEYLFSPGWGSLLSTSFQQLLSIRIKLIQRGAGAGLSFSQAQMANQQYMDDNNTLFNPVTASDTENLYFPSAPQGLQLAVLGPVISLSWQAQPNCVYAVYSATNSQPPVWQTEATGLTQPGWSEQPQMPVKFYRVVAESIPDNRTGENSED